MQNSASKDLHVPMPRAAGVSTVPAEPLLVDSPADEVWADQGLADIESLLLSDEDGDETHEFIVIDALPRSDSAKGAHRPAWFTFALAHSSRCLAGSGGCVSEPFTRGLTSKTVQRCSVLPCLDRCPSRCASMDLMSKPTHIAHVCLPTDCVLGMTLRH